MLGNVYTRQSATPGIAPPKKSVLKERRISEAREDVHANEYTAVLQTALFTAPVPARCAGLVCEAPLGLELRGVNFADGST